VWISVSACLDLERGLPEPPAVLGLEPREGVPDDQVLTVALSEPVFVSGDWPIAVVRPGAGSVPCAVESKGSVLEIGPRPRWPAGASLEVAIGEGIVAEEGAPLAAVRLPFTTVPPDRPELPVTVRAPVPGDPAPLNLAYVTLAIDEEASDVALASGAAGEVPLVRDRASGGLARFALPPSRGPCRPLCPETLYEIAAPGYPIAEGALGRVATGSTADDAPPEVVSLVVLFPGGQPIVEVAAREPIYGEGVAIDANGGAIRLSRPPMPGTILRLEPSSPLAPGALYDVSIRIEDRSANRRALDPFPIATPPAIVVSIGEIVASPLRDWNDSEGGGVPFDESPGFGRVTSTDEWVEIENRSSAAIDLEASGLELRTIDGTPAVTPLAGAPALYFGDGGSRTRWAPGEALVVRPAGSMSASGLVVEIAAGDRILDRVELSGEPGADHLGGPPSDVRYEAVARRAHGGFGWCRATPGDPLPATDCLND
jgi:hypothetical protein